MNKFYILIFTLLISFTGFSQDAEEEISIEDQRINKIKELLETVEVNKSIYIKEDQLRINEFLDLIDERQSMLSKAKTDLQNENLRNKRLEKEFEENEKLLAELEERSIARQLGVVIKNDAELLPGEYLEGEKKIGIGYSHQVNNIGRDLFNIGVSYNVVKSNSLLSLGIELIPIENLSVRGSYSNLQLNSVDAVESILHRPKASFGLGYVYRINKVAWLEISYATKLNTYPSVMESFSNPMSKSDMFGMTIKIH